MVSIIIPYHNEGQDFIETIINQIKETVSLTGYEIIVVDDYSDKPLKDIDNVLILRHNENKGVGAAFDSGVIVSKYDNLFLFGSDIRFINNGWDKVLLDEIEKYPKSLICGTCVGLNTKTPENLNIENRKKISRGTGATILFFHDNKSNPKKDKSFKGIIEAKWLPRINNTDGLSVEIPCILGAAYGVKKEWYNYIDGWWGHKHWGTLEPYISLKSWMFGGDCRFLPSFETGHIFKSVGTHGTPQTSIKYNKLLVATLLFDDYDRYINFLGGDNIVKKAKEIYTLNFEDIIKKKDEYKQKTVYSIYDYARRFKIDIRLSN